VSFIENKKITLLYGQTLFNHRSRFSRILDPKKALFLMFLHNKKALKTLILSAFGVS
jgi:hypothetical protein